MIADTCVEERLGILEQRVAAAVARFQANDPDPNDPFRGMYVTDEKARSLLNAPPIDLTDGSGPTHVEEASALGLLAERFELAPIDVEFLVVAMAPDLDQRFERLYGYLHDDLTRRRASIGLAIELAGCSATDAEARSRLAIGSPLLQAGLLLIEEEDRPFLTRSLRVPDRVVSHLLGDNTLDSTLHDVVVARSPISGERYRRIARALGTSARIYLHERVDAGASGLAATALIEAGCSDALVIDLTRVHLDDRQRRAKSAIRECQLRGAGLVCVQTHLLLPAIIRSLTNSSIELVMVGAQPWNPDWCDTATLTIPVATPPEEEQNSMWMSSLASEDLFDIRIPNSFRLGPNRICKAVIAARAAAAADAEPVGYEHVIAGAKAQNAVGLSRLARRVQPHAGWDDIILDKPTEHQLRHLIARVAHRQRVLDEWGLRRGGRGEGIIALFAGDSGTGKTLAAEIIAKELGLEIYVVDLSTVVDKYIGETEKNLDRIFDEAEGVNGILFFDEADALFGKRTDVGDSKDRYANVEVAYLLQRLESFDGLGILATNLRNNMDDAFSRRLSVVVDFPEPSEEQRRSMWGRMTRALPLTPDVDLDFCARSFQLTGGNIRNIVVSAAYLGASNGQRISMGDVIDATAIEYRKLGRLCTEAEFGSYHLHLTKEHET